MTGCKAGHRTIYVTRQVYQSVPLHFSETWAYHSRMNNSKMILIAIMLIAILITEIMLAALYAAKIADDQMARMKEDNNVNDKRSI